MFQLIILLLVIVSVIQGRFCWLWKVL